MAEIFGKILNKKEILRRVGDIEQLAHINSIELKEGDANGMRALDVRNGGGLHFMVVAERGLDITVADINGIPLAIRFHPGEVKPNFYEDHPYGFIKSWAGGLLTTCGLTNVGSPGKEGLENLIQHGNYTHISAKNVQFEGTWIDDEYRLQIRGIVREVAPLYPNKNIELRRKITTWLGKNKIQIEDEVENIGFKTSPFMLLYHCNFGYPLIDTSSEILMNSSGPTCKEGSSNEDIDEWNHIQVPTKNYTERVYYHDIKEDNNGFCKVGIINRDIFNGKKLELSISYKKEALPLLTQWKMMGESEYAIGLEPAICHVEGREKEREVFKSLQHLEPGEIRKYSLEFEVKFY